MPISLQDNPGLCGPVPACLAGRVTDLAGTGLIDPQNVTSNPNGGVCAEEPPACSAANGCRCRHLCCNPPACIFW